MKYFIYGGSFNPVTVAHVGIIEKILKTYPDAKVIVVPCSINYKNVKGGFQRQSKGDS